MCVSEIAIAKSFGFAKLLEAMVKYRGIMVGNFCKMNSIGRKREGKTPFRSIMSLCLLSSSSSKHLPPSFAYFSHFSLSSRLLQYLTNSFSIFFESGPLKSMNFVKASLTVIPFFESKGNGVSYCLPVYSLFISHLNVRLWLRLYTVANFSTSSYEFSG